MAKRDYSVFVVIEGVSNSQARKIKQDVTTAKNHIAPKAKGEMKIGNRSGIAANLQSFTQKYIGKGGK